MCAKIIPTLLALTAFTSSAIAQTPAPVVVQAVPATQAPVAAAAAPNSAANALKPLQDLKSANDEILKKQGETLLQLDEIEKAAAQLKIYSKRG